MKHQCRNCGERNADVLGKIDYDAEVLYQGVLYKFTIVDLELPICQVCGERTFTKDVDEQFTVALHKHLDALK